jgi:Tfp pilus assembly protein PilF
MAHARYGPVILRLGMLLPILAPVAMAQKPPTPPPAPPPSAPSSGLTNFPVRGTSPVDSTDQFVLFLRGRVATNDSTPIPNDMVVERVCNNKVRQQAYAASRGDFSMQLGSTTDAFLDATAEPTWQTGVGGKDSTMGIPRRELNNCEIRARAPGFRDGVINLDGLDMTASNIDVGVIVVVRSIKTKGATLSATPYMAPKEARKAYENGLAAEKKSNLPGARKYFEAAVATYPNYASAWFQLGHILEAQNERDTARSAYTQATAIDKRFLPPYLSLATMAYQDKEWNALLTLTDHILSLDPLGRADVTGFIVDLDAVNCADAYFYNAAANYHLNKIAAAERSALKAERIALPANFPELHLLLAAIYVRKNDSSSAISELKTYLELAPHSANADSVRAKLAELEKQSESVPVKAPPEHM